MPCSAEQNIEAVMKRYLALCWDLTRRDFLVRYQGTVLGVCWPLAYSLLNLLIFAFAFALVLRVRWPAAANGTTQIPSILMIFCGLIPYFFIAEVVVRAPTVIVGSPNYVKKVKFPLELLPVTVVNVGLLLLVVNLFILILSARVAAGIFSASVFLFPIILLPFFLLAVGLSWLLAAIGVFFRDVAQIMPLFTQVLMFTAPVCYPREAVPNQWQALLGLNPLTYFVQALRDIALLGTGVNWPAWLTQVIVGSLVCFLGYTVFARTRYDFADLL
jgi:lipopolysaccharide transport system permease protein